MSKKSEKEIKLSDMSSKGRAKKHKTRLIILNIALSIVLVVSFLITALMGAYAFGLAGWNPGGLGNDIESEDGDFEDLIISTNADVSYILVVGADLSENLTDVIMIACLDHKSKTLNLIQIPRDTFIGTDINTNKVNAVYGDPRTGEKKINALRRRLSSHLGIPLDHYVIFTLKGFRNAVDAIGGVKINVTAENGLKIEDQDNIGSYYRIGPGWVTLDGNSAAGFVRKRYGSEEGYGLGDISRIQSQRIFYAALFKKLQNVNGPQMTSIAKNCYSEISTDMTVNEILGYALDVKKIPFSSIGIYSVPGQFCSYQPSGYRNKLSFYSIHKSEYVELFNAHFNPYGDPITVNDIAIRELHTEIGQKTTQSVVDPGGTLSKIIDKKEQ